MKKQFMHTTPSKVMDGRTLAGFQSRVLRHWHKRGRHALPWRKTHNAYHVLLSEIMLQQTQVDRVIPKYNAFVKTFPSVNILAQATLQDVLLHWQGLGYNRRAKMLRDAAKNIVQTHGGIVPRAHDALIQLPGVGAYTADAVRAFVFDIPVVMIETNIRTALLCEFFANKTCVSDTKLIPLLERLVVRTPSSRIWYWALMDYGAYIKQHYGNKSQGSAHYKKQTPFSGSLRQVRGAVIRALTQSPGTTSQLAVRVSHPAARVDEALWALAHDGLVTKKRSEWTIQ